VRGPLGSGWPGEAARPKRRPERLCQIAGCPGRSRSPRGLSGNVQADLTVQFVGGWPPHATSVDGKAAATRSFPATARFVAGSLLEEAGFERSVPRKIADAAETRLFAFAASLVPSERRLVCERDRRFESSSLPRGVRLSVVPDPTNALRSASPLRGNRLRPLVCNDFSTASLLIGAD
jgi:hypothetical protein